MNDNDETTSAVISQDGRYRYSLTRMWDRDRPPMIFVMLNPSTADASVDDPTIRRCRGFAKREGAGGLIVVNLYAYRATKPATLWDQWARGVSIVGPDNDRHILDALTEAYEMPVVAAWGAHATPEAGQRFANLVDTFDRSFESGPPTQLVCLGRTKSGAPRHPLYVRADAPFEPWAEALV